ncbi:MAG: hypothetical protein NTX59_06970 [Elusimicrobia bacterium]|nr:hypothetical protein [Elusimicrobiota bacterium]
MRKFFYAAAALGFAGLLFFYSLVRPAPAFPPPSALREVRHSALEDMLALSLGARRLFADLWFIRLMQYYGSHEPCPGGEEPDEDGECPGGPRFGEGKYPEFLSLSRHIAALDPYFKNAVLYSAGSLAFNMNRPKEAENILNYALANTPRDWKFLTMLTAIGYSKSAEPAKVAQIIAPLVREHDCPVMLKQLAAFLNKKAGNYAAAAALYTDMLQTSKDPFYTSNAKKELKKLALLRIAPGTTPAVEPKERLTNRPAK